MSDRVKLGVMAAMAMAMAPEHIMYDLRRGHTGIRQQPDTEPIDSKPNKFALEAIERAKQKRAMRKAKRLKHRSA